ncbi:MAG: hypothetical protein OEY51_04275, partial [Cyclobacteriaceae bacterium]|nr:hypothetical protein [Cyclobacteriaceae bacterium]
GASHNIELEVRNPNPPLSTVVEAVVEAGKSWSASFTPHGISGTNKAVLEISSIPPIDLGKRTSQLISYPHGCVEQTTSAAFPQLYISDISALSKEQKEEIEKNVKAAINRLQQFQLPDGGFAYWPGALEPDEWGTNYAGHFLVEAKLKGYNIPGSMLRNWKKYQSKLSNRWKKSPKNQLSDFIQAYRLYTLALDGTPETGAMNRLRESETLSIQASWRLAAAYGMTGQPEAAKALIDKLPTQVKAYNGQFNTYGSPLRDQAMILETLSILKDYTKGAGLIKIISAELSKPNQWLSTQTTAYCLIAVGKYLGSNKGNGQLKFSYKVYDQEKKNATTELPVIQLPIKISTLKEGNIQINNEGTGLFYTRLVVTGTPEKGDETDVQNNLRLSVDYYNHEGNKVDVESLEQGTEFYAEVSVTNTGFTGEYKNLALTQVFPSGWEINNARLDDTDQYVAKDIPTYQDIRDDRVYTYFDLKPNQKKTFHVLLNASYAGDYYLPAVKCEAMYDRAVLAVKSGKEVSVVQAGVQ